VVHGDHFWSAWLAVQTESKPYHGAADAAGVSAALAFG
jgi:hypothetical protein